MAKISSWDLVFHVLNVGHADAILVGFPAAHEEEREYGLIDCGNGTKVRGYLKKMFPDPDTRKRLLFMCATHPHRDHIIGMNSILKDPTWKPLWFWDSGFRLPSVTYSTILDKIANDPEILMMRGSSGMERYFGKVRVTALASMALEWLSNTEITYALSPSSWPLR